MIGRLTGVIVERSPDGACVLEVSGVGYEVIVPLGTLGRLPRPPETSTLHVHTHAREDALMLYGFATAEDRTAFRALLGVSSIGPKLAMSILGALDAPELARAVAMQDRTRFKGISGVGSKTIERVLLDLKDKLPVVPVRVDGASKPRPSGVVAIDPLERVREMLVTMGYKPGEAERATAHLELAANGDETRPVETLLREALAALG